MQQFLVIKKIFFFNYVILVRLTKICIVIIYFWHNYSLWFMSSTNDALTLLLMTECKTIIISSL